MNKIPKFTPTTKGNFGYYVPTFEHLNIMHYGGFDLIELYLFGRLIRIEIANRLSTKHEIENRKEICQ